MKKTTILLQCGLLLLAAACARAPKVIPTGNTDIDAAFTALPGYEYGASREALTVIADAVRTSQDDDAMRARLRTSLAAIFAGESSAEAKQFASRQLAVIGGAAEVRALAGDLENPRLSHIARIGLESITDESAGRALRRALSRTEGEVKIGIIDSLGMRGEQRSVAPLARLLGDEDRQIARAAAKALGKIGGQDAAAAVAKAWGGGNDGFAPALIDAYLLCGDAMAKAGQGAEAQEIYSQVYNSDAPVHLRAAAFDGWAMLAGVAAAGQVIELLASDDLRLRRAAARLVRRLPGEGAAEALASGLHRDIGDAAKQTLLVGLAERGDRSARGPVLELAANTSGEVQVAAIDAVGALAGAEAVPLLIKVAAGDGDAANSARASLDRLSGRGVDRAIVEALDSVPSSSKVELIGALERRRAARVEAALLKATRDGDSAVRIAAFHAVGVLARPDQLSALVKRFGDELTDKGRAAAEDAVVALAMRVSDPTRRTAEILSVNLATVTTPQRLSMMRSIGRLGGEEALSYLDLSTASPTRSVRLAALEGLGLWPTGEPAASVLESLRAARDEQQHKVALKSYIRLIGLESDRSAAQTLTMFREALNLAQDTEEKRSVLAGLATVRSAGALELLSTNLDDEDLRDTAAASAVAIAPSVSLAAPLETKSAMEKIADFTKDGALRSRAERVVSNIERFEGFITAWQVAGPYTATGLDASELHVEVFGPEKGEPADWKPMPVGQDRGRPWLLDLARAIGGDNRVAYLRTRVWSPAAQEATLELGSDDGIKVWLGGELVHDMNASRGVSPAQDLAPVKLAEGWNELLLKITNGGGDWAACARFAADKGVALPGIRASADFE